MHIRPHSTAGGCGVPGTPNTSKWANRRTIFSAQTLVCPTKYANLYFSPQSAYLKSENSDDATKIFQQSVGKRSLVRRIHQDGPIGVLQPAC